VEATQVFSFLEFEVRLADLLDCEIIIHFTSFNSTTGSSDQVVNDSAVSLCIVCYSDNVQAGRLIVASAIADDNRVSPPGGPMPIDVRRSLYFIYRSVNARSVL
jgi:hypothetical protein